MFKTLLILVAAFMALCSAAPHAKHSSKFPTVEVMWNADYTKIYDINAFRQEWRKLCEDVVAPQHMHHSDSVTSGSAQYTAYVNCLGHQIVSDTDYTQVKGGKTVDMTQQTLALCKSWGWCWPYVAPKNNSKTH